MTSPMPTATLNRSLTPARVDGATGRALRVAIVGGGLSGTLVCLNLLRTWPRVRITLFERVPRQLNRGVAYSARLSRQLLNVPAARMGLFPEDPEGFLRWARSGPLPHAGPDDFLPRSLFGDYVHDAFHEGIVHDPGRVRVVAGEVIAIDHRPVYGHRVRLADGTWYDQDAVVLATGNAPPGHLPRMSDEALGHDRYVAWPWAPGAMARIGVEDEVLFVGAGLTMVDLVLTLRDHGHKGLITVFSRHGLLPRVHAPAAPWTMAPPPTMHGQVRASLLLTWVRGEVDRAVRMGLPWQSVLDAVKPHVRPLWQQMHAEERKRFLRHLRSHWEVHRHRMPVSAHERLAHLAQQGTLRTVAARVQEVAMRDGRFTVTCLPRGERQPTLHQARWLINCSGPQADTSRREQSLLLDLRNKGLASWDELHLGLRTTVEGALLNSEGKVSQGLYAIGPPCKASLWECTAVPEIREQASSLALAMQRDRPGTAKGLRRAMFRLMHHLAWPAA